MSDLNKPSRREFLKGSTAAAAGTALAGSLSIGRSAHAAGSDVIKVALIGAGSRGTGAVGQQMSADKGVRLVAVADAFQSKALNSLKGLRAQHGDKIDVPPDRVFAGLDAHKKALATDADLVVMASSPGFRARHFKAAIEAGKHVFMEKPCCVDAHGYKSLIESSKLADQKGLFVGVGLQRRHEPRYMETVKRLHDGAIGDVMFTRVYWNGPGIWNRRREALAKVLARTPTEIEYQIWNWYHFCWLSGDNIGEQHIHNLDVGNWVKDAHPVEANGMGGCTARYLGRNKGTGQIFDHHFVEYTYADGAKMFSQCRHMARCWGHVTEYAHGTKGASHVGGCTISNADGETVWSFGRGGGNGHQQEQTDLLAALRAGNRYNEAPYGATSSMTAVLGRIANYSGKTVKWDELVAKGTSELPESLEWDAPAPVQKGDDGQYPVPVPGQFNPF